MSRYPQGFLRLFRTDGTAVRALLFALLLQILLPVFGTMPAQAAPSADTLTICTAQGMITLVADGEGGWTQKHDAAQSGITCAFCLPLLSAAATPSAAPGLPLPVVTKVAPQRLAATHLPTAARILSSRPRGPPALV